MKTFQVIIPTITPTLVESLLDQIIANTVIPTKIIIINNSSQLIKMPYCPKTRIWTTSPPIPLSVNASWNLGISQLDECDYVSVLNDDILIHNTFFEKINTAFEELSDICGCVCPRTRKNRKEFCEDQIENIRTNMRTREGWAFTIRKELLDRIPSIPPELQLFYGDYWFFWHSKRLAKRWYRDCNINIYHMVGESVRKLNYRERNLQKTKEKFAFYDAKLKFISKK